MITPRDVRHVLDMVYERVGGVVVISKKQSNSAQTEHATGFCASPDDIVRYISRVVLDCPHIGVRYIHRLDGIIEDISACPVTRMTEIDSHPDTLHLVNDSATIICQAAVLVLTPSSHEVIGVVRD